MNNIGIATRVHGVKGTAFAVPWGYLAATSFPEGHPLVRFEVFVEDDDSSCSQGDEQDISEINVLSIHGENSSLVRLGRTAFWLGVGAAPLDPGKSSSPLPQASHQASHQSAASIKPSSNQPSVVVSSDRPSIVPSAARPSVVLPSNQPSIVLPSDRPSIVPSSTRPSIIPSSTRPSSKTSSTRPSSGRDSASSFSLLPKGVTLKWLKSAFWSSPEVVDVPADGHCGYHVLFGSQNAASSPQRALTGRRVFFKYLDSPTGACKDFPGHSDSFWREAKERVFPGGRLPSGSSFLSASPPQYLSNEDLPWMAQMMQAIICVCDARDPQGWASFVPININTNTRLPVIGMYHTEQHWQRCFMKASGPFPPVVTCTWLWGAQDRQKALSSDGHQRLHQRYAFAVWKAPADGQCGCEGGEESSSPASTKRKRDSAVVVE
ncbi:unnamed protein product [Jaminaea pallidilutea]